MSTSGWPYSNRCRRSLRIMPSRSVSSLVSSRVFPVLLLAMCLLSMSVIAGTTTDQVAKDQVKHYLPDFRSGPKNFHLEVVLQKYTSYLGDANSVSLRIGEDLYNSTKMGTRWKNKPEEIKLGYFHFVNEIQGNYDIEAARRSALQWPVLGDMVHWKFVNDMIMYLIFCDAADESTLENWRNAMPKSLLPLLAAAYFDQKNCTRCSAMFLIIIHLLIWVPGFTSDHPSLVSHSGPAHRPPRSSNCTGISAHW
ncbi:hypothetical protein F5880DRAFT_567019 [Lentinula raphanica]|nr:hypothetical protein F5880DRAFT_567019 [Lentinula raphanica]